MKTTLKMKATYVAEAAYEEAKEKEKEAYAAWREASEARIKAYLAIGN